MRKTPIEATEMALNLFNRFSDEELSQLLESAGVVAMKDRDILLHQALVVWFHGQPPSDLAMIAWLRKHVK